MWYVREYGTLGNGVMVRRSHTAPGLGLYATRNFQKGEIVTVYSGNVIDKCDADMLRQDGLHSHCISMNSREVIDGFRVPYKAGLGGAQFANTGGLRKHCNTKFVVGEFFVADTSHTGGHMTRAIKAKKDIAKDEEILVYYSIRDHVQLDTFAPSIHMYIYRLAGTRATFLMNEQSSMVCDKTKTKMRKGMTLRATQLISWSISVMLSVVDVEVDQGFDKFAFDHCNSFFLL